MPWPVHPTGFFGARGDSDTYRIERSLRFNSADSAYLSRSFSTGNRKTWTWSGWVKFLGPKTNLYETIFLTDSSNSGAGSAYTYIVLDHYSPSAVYTKIGLYCEATSARVFTNATLRDYSAWYHLVFVMDTTQATESNRFKIYINGTQQTNLVAANGGAPAYPAQDSEPYLNNNYSHTIGAFQANAFSTYRSNFYLAEVNFIDGQALTPSSFGETDAITGRWKAKAFSGTYGTNGFYLSFKDNTSTTTLGYDDAGSNDWTLNNFSVTAGVDNDSLVDSPTNYGIDSGVGGEVRGNYATLNPLDGFSSTTAIATKNGNLEATFAGGGGSYATIKATIPCEYKCYFEGVLPDSTSGDWWYAGWVKTETTPTTANVAIINNTYYPDAGAYYFLDDKFYVSGSSVYDGSESWVNGDIVMFAFDPDTGKCWIGRNGTWLNSGNPASGTGNLGSVTTGNKYSFALNSAGSHTWKMNFGQRPFAYTAPSGFKALCTQNLDKSTAITTSGTFTGNASADGPVVWLNGIPTAMTINGNSVTFGTHADKLASGFKIRTSSTSYNASGSNTFTVSTTAEKFKYARAQEN
jgi:hypothetical protein